MSNIVHIDVLRVDVSIPSHSPVFLPDLSLEAEFPVTHGTNEGFLPFASLLPSIEFAQSFLLGQLGVNDLVGLEVLEDLVLDVEELNGEFPMECPLVFLASLSLLLWLISLELLSHVHEEVEDVLR